MLKTFLFLVKAALVIGVLIWLAEQEGNVQIDWMEYTVNVHVGLFLAGLFTLILVSIFIYRVLKTVVDFPASYRYYSQIRAKNKGYRALTQGLTAVAAGDAKAAVKYAEKARSLMPEDKGLPLLLEAQAARLDGREGDAQESFAGLIENKDTSFLGVRGLLQSSMDVGDDRGALALARQALKLHPKQPWILRTVYDLEIALREWSAAEATLKRAVKASAITKERALNDRVAMDLAIALSAESEGLQDVAASQYRAALKLNDRSIPAIVLAAEYYIRQGQTKRAKILIEKAWKRSPHAAMVDVWDQLMPKRNSSDALDRLKWYEKLVKLNGDNARAQVAAGQAACDAALWGEARKYFMAAEAIRPSKELYKALAVLEDRANNDREAARAWLEKAADVAGERVWICRESGRVYPNWSPIAAPHGSFNTIEWNYHIGEDGDDGEAVLLTASVVDPMDDTLIEAPNDNAKTA
ncbi:MAG: heme biosynthesis protein HemY [Alphaproteobacteria bacterium]|nr:heme biosynthesis protein HemY [Alphaproteobacteria bacterium]